MSPSPESISIGTSFQVQLVDDRSVAERAVAREMAQLARERASAGARAVWGLATGATMRGVYTELVRLFREEGFRYESVVTFNLDEYVGLEAHDATSFRRYMDQHLFDHVDVPADAIHIPDGSVEADRIDACCADYEQAIRDAGGIDLQLLGIGRNGHVGFNEPGAPRDSRTRLVELAATTRADARPYFGEGGVPSSAITMGVATILEARRIRVLAFGEKKAAAIERALAGPPTPDLPASFLRDHGDLALWLDGPAAARLEPDEL